MIKDLKIRETLTDFTQKFTTIEINGYIEQIKFTSSSNVRFDIYEDDMLILSESNVNNINYILRRTTLSNSVMINNYSHERIAVNGPLTIIIRGELNTIFDLRIRYNG